MISKEKCLHHLELLGQRDRFLNIPFSRGPRQCWSSKCSWWTGQGRCKQWWWARRQTGRPQGCSNSLCQPCFPGIMWHWLRRLIWLRIYLSDWPVDPVDPDTARDEPAAEEEGDETLHGVGGLGVLVRPSLGPPDPAQHPDKVFKCRERA